MTQLEEIGKLLADYHERTGRCPSVRHRWDGAGYITLGGRAQEWDHPLEAMAVIRKALAPPPPTKEEALALCDELTTYSGEVKEAIRDIRRYIESTGEPT